MNNPNQLKVLDLFAGLEGWSKPFRDRGHNVFSTDFDPKFKVNLVKDILNITPSDIPWVPDIILASPPCESFSVMNIGKNWTGPNDEIPNQPKTESAKLGLKILERTVWLINELNPTWFVIENPRGKMRKMPILSGLERRTVTYCQYGMRWQKPTDLFGKFPALLNLRDICKPGSSCHESAPRGSRTGIQGNFSKEERAIIPYQLSMDICLSVEKTIEQNK